MDAKNILMLGLPETGKTSYLAAFVYYVDSTIVEKSLTQYQLSSNSTYITSIVQAWLMGNPQERTKVTATKNSKTEADIFLEEAKSQNKFTLHIPDFYGETFEMQFTDRYLELNYIEQIKASSGILLFIHPEKIKDATLIEDIVSAQSVAEALNKMHADQSINESSIKLPSQEEVTVFAEPFKREEIPTQVVIVDLLEAHLEYLTKMPLNLAIIVSAWDVIKKDAPDLSPLRWIEKALPLLYQFLASNPEKINFNCFGVSALGGDIEVPEVAAKLKELTEPGDRILVQENDVTHKNIASPIEWILEQWQKNTK
jgi:hypothetical protein